MCVLLLKWDHPAPAAEETRIFNLPICRELFPMKLSILLLHHSDSHKYFQNGYAILYLPNPVLLDLKVISDCHCI